MQSIKKLGLAAVMALALVAFVAASASATTVTPRGVAFSARSTNSTLSVSGGGTISCTSSTISGTTPSGTAATLSTPISLVYSGCTAFGLAATVTVPANCGLVLNITYRSATDIPMTVTIPSGCTITISVPAISCTLTIRGPQTVGNGTSGAGGIAWRNGTASPAVFSSATMNNAVVSITSSGGGFGCPSAGAHTGTLSGGYTVTSPTPAPGVTVGP